jgi:hypothetical protein
MSISAAADAGHATDEATQFPAYGPVEAALGCLLALVAGATVAVGPFHRVGALLTLIPVVTTGGVVFGLTELVVLVVFLLEQCLGRIAGGLGVAVGGEFDEQVLIDLHSGRAGVRWCRPHGR